MAMAIGAHTKQIWTIGHSKHDASRFIEILNQFEITAVVDVRTIPMSKMAPQFNEAALKAALMEVGISYIAMGKELGGRPAEDDLYDKHGHVLYSRLADSTEFKQGLNRLLIGMEQFRIAVMCSEGKPEGCHRHLLIGKVLVSQGCEVINILPDGSFKTYTELSPESNQESLIDLGEEEMWKSVLPVRQESQQNDSFFS